MEEEQNKKKRHKEDHINKNKSRRNIENRPKILKEVVGCAEETDKFSITIDTTNKRKNDLTIATEKHSNRKKIMEGKRRYDAERKKKQKAKIHANPTLFAKFLQDQKKNNLIRKKRGLRLISDITEKEYKIQRQSWKKSQAKYRKNLKGQTPSNSCNQGESKQTSKIDKKIFINSKIEKYEKINK